MEKGAEVLGYWILDIGYWILDIGYWENLDVKKLTYNKIILAKTKNQLSTQESSIHQKSTEQIEIIFEETFTFLQFIHQFNSLFRCQEQREGRCFAQ